MLSLDSDKIYLKPSLPIWKIRQVQVGPKTQSKGIVLLRGAGIWLIMLFTVLSRALVKNSLNCFQKTDFKANFKGK